MSKRQEEKATVLEEEIVEEKTEKEPEEHEKEHIDVDTLIEKGKKGKLSPSDLDDALEEMNFDVDMILLRSPKTNH